MHISDWSSDVCSSDLLERFRDFTRMHQPAAIEHDRSVADVAQQASAVTGQHHDLAATQPALHPLLGLAHEIGIPGTDPLVHHDDVMLHRCGDREPQTHLLAGGKRAQRSEEHTSELQSLMRISYAVFCLKKKKARLKISM